MTLNKESGRQPQRGRNIKYRSYAFTEQGVAMLSSVLKSRRAAQVDTLESKYDRQFKVVFDAIRQMMAEPAPAPRRRIGFVSDG